MIKKLQIRGISRNPSDRMTSDGGCSESLNVMLDNSEVVPMTTPEDITDTIGLSGPDDILAYIHKTSSYTNYIIYQTGELGTVKDGLFAPFLAFDEGEYFNSITSIGNTIICLTDKNMYYILYKDSEYILLGSKVPSPAINFLSQNNISQESSSKKSLTEKTYQASDLPGINREEGTKLGDPDQQYEVFSTAGIDIMSNIWSTITDIYTILKSNRAWSYPMFMRAAVKLYDGSYTCVSCPVLVGVGYEDDLITVDLDFKSNSFPRQDGITGINTYTVKGTVKFNLHYYVSLAIKDLKKQYKGWEDIVKSVDIFMSTPVIPYILKNNIYPFVFNSEYVDTGSSGLNVYKHDTGTYTLDPVNSKENFEDILLSHSQFYLVKSYDITSLDDLSDEFVLDGIDDYFDQDILATQPQLDENYAYQSEDYTFGKRGVVYNSRLCMFDIGRKLTSGYRYLNASILPVKSGEIELTYYSYKFRYHIRTSDGQEKTVNAKTFTGQIEIFPVEGANGHQRVYGWLAYPNSNCFEVDIEVTSYSSAGADLTRRTMTFTMKPHPFLNCAYLYLGINKELDTFVTSSTGTHHTEENDTDNISNKLYVSDVDNPFVFPASSIYTVSTGEIRNIAMVTRALSTGQFGQFPLYVFTSEGIWAMNTAEDGTFMQTVPMSREVIINPALLVSLDNAVVFLTDKGMMMLAGSDITNISPDMRGKPYQMTDEITMISKDARWQRFASVLNQSQPYFNEFMKEAEAAYDYEGRRIVFMSKKFKDIYVYMIDTVTWHKFADIGEDSSQIQFYSPVNSYPDCLVNGTVTDSEQENRIYNLSTRYSPDAQTIPGIILTRPFDLGSPDVLKMIRNIRLRGQFDPSANKAMYVLYGSNDGMTFTRLTSLHKSSWKFYRLLIVTDFTSGETLSWVDVDYEERFTNRLR